MTYVFLRLAGPQLEVTMSGRGLQMRRCGPSWRGGDRVGPQCLRGDTATAVEQGGVGRGRCQDELVLPA